MIERKERKYIILAIGMLLFMASFMLVLAFKRSFNLDELDRTIGPLTGKSTSGIPMLRMLLSWGTVPPLYFMIMKPFYELLPYGEIFLLIPSIVFAILGILITAKAGKIIGGTDIGFIAVCIAVGSATLIAYGWELRPYTITFCLSSLTLLMYIKRLKQETDKSIRNYGISLVLLLYCHYFGLILALSYALIDLRLYLRKKISAKCFFSYALAGLLFLPWVIMVLYTYRTNLSALFNFWAGIPGDLEPLNTVFFLLSNSLLYLLLFYVGFNLTLFKGVKANENKAQDESAIWLFISVGIIWTILLVYIYSKIFNPNGSLYVNRYFLVIMPHVFLITAFGFFGAYCAIQRLFFKTAIKKRFLNCIIIALVCSGIFQTYQKSYSNITSINQLYRNQPYREFAELLFKEGQANSANSLVICSNGTAWVEYYFSKRGLDIPANVANCQPQDTVWQFISNGQYIQPIALSREDILRYEIIYLFKVLDSTDFPEYLNNVITEYYFQQDHQTYPFYYCHRE
jgi:uncharacterized membrane protein